jgi:hypothetical protein
MKVVTPNGAEYPVSNLVFKDTTSGSVVEFTAMPGNGFLIGQEPIADLHTEKTIYAITPAPYGGSFPGHARSVAFINGSKAKPSPSDEK